VSKNGNLLLNIPVRADGTIDEKETQILEEIAIWMKPNSKAIFGTRPWSVFGEGPASEGASIQSQGFNEGKGKPFTAEDIRFTVKGKTLYAITLGVPIKSTLIHALGSNGGQHIEAISQLGFDGTLKWSQEADALSIEPPSVKPASDAAVVYKITLR